MKKYKALLNVWEPEKPTVPCLFLARTNQGVTAYECVNKNGKLILLPNYSDSGDEKVTMENITADEYLIVEYYEE